MTRIALAAIVLIASTGCDEFDFSDLDINWDMGANMEDGMLYTPTNGVVMHENGRDAHVGMHGTTCEVDANGGWIGTDHDIAGTDDEVVVDTKTAPMGEDKVLVTTDTGVHVITKDDFFGDDRVEQHVPGTIDAGFTGDNTIAVVADDPVAGCSVSWVDEATGITDTTSVPSDYCAPDATMSVDKNLGDVFLASPNAEVLVVDPNGFEPIGWNGMDIIVHDPFTDMVYVAETGGDTVYGMTEQGAEVWTNTLGGEIVSIDDAGVRQGAIVLLRTSFGNDQVRYLDGDTGTDSLELETPEGSTDIAVSDNGYGIALVGDDDVYFTSL